MAKARLGVIHRALTTSAASKYLLSWSYGGTRQWETRCAGLENTCGWGMWTVGNGEMVQLLDYIVFDKNDTSNDTKKPETTEAQIQLRSWQKTDADRLM